MGALTQGVDERVIELQAVPRPVAAFAADYPSGHLIPLHSHPRAQFIHATAGVMTVATKAATWVVPPHRALWMPAGVEHTIRASGQLALRTLYIAVDAAPDLPAACRVVTVTPLLLQLILRAVALPALYDPGGPAGRLVQVMLDEIRALPAAPLNLPAPTDPRLRRIADALIAQPGDNRSLHAWGRAVGASERTLARLFPAETGLGFRQWRERARLVHALARLADGEAVTSVALDLGYDSPSAFTAMFRRVLGQPPSRYFAAGQA
jgi:AraC-like DNA-binding protein